MPKNKNIEKGASDNVNTVPETKFDWKRSNNVTANGGYIYLSADTSHHQLIAYAQVITYDVQTTSLQES